MPSYKLTFGDRVLSYQGHEGYVSYISGPQYQYTTLWETDTPFKNMYSITLNDSIDNYDEYIVYGSAVKDGNVYYDTQNRYFVSHNGVQQGGCVTAGTWGTSKFLLLNGTEMWLSGTSGYIASSYFIGEGNNTTAWTQGTFTGRTADLHPYKIVGIKEIQ